MSYVPTPSWTGPLKRPRTGSLSLSQYSAPSQPAFTPAGFRRYRRRFTLFGRSRRGTYSRGATAQLQDPSIRVRNPRRDPVYRTQISIATPNTFSFTNVSGISFAAIFDPSGTFGNTNAVGAPLQVPNWTSLKQIFDQYKVNKIIVNFRYLNQSGGIPGPVPLLVRYNYDKSITAPSVASMMASTRVVDKMFSADNCQLTYSFYPKVNYLVDNESALATDGRSVQSMDWVDMDYPVELLGLMMANGYALTADQFIQTSITYDISFRNQW